MTNTKTIDTLVEDIYDLLENGKIEIDDSLIKKFAVRMGMLMKRRLEVPEGKENNKTKGGGFLRMSSIGKPDRQVYYDVHRAPREKLRPNTFMKFMYGDVVEEVLLFLAEASGHKVEGEQEEIIIDGIKGHRDAVIDGTTVDVKSASRFGFRKFKDGSLSKDDPFGYIAQISGYTHAYGRDSKVNTDVGAFLAIDKSQGHLAVLKVPKSEQIDPEARIKHLKKVVERDEPPEKCYEPKPKGKAGNKILATGCQYCPFKHHCWSDANGGQGLRTFLYSNKPTDFVEVVKEPRVPELDNTGVLND